MGRLGGVKFKSWLKTKAGIASLVTFIIAPAGVMAVNSQVNNNEELVSVQPETSSSISRDTQSENLATSGSDSGNAARQSNIQSNQTSVTVDDQFIEVPNNGSVHKVIETEGGTMTIDITTQNDSSGDSKTKSRHKFSISSKSKSEIESSSSYHESSN